jgi:hypothetical protein
MNFEDAMYKSCYEISFSKEARWLIVDIAIS